MSVAHGNRRKLSLDSIRQGSTVHIKSREWYEENKDKKGRIKCGVEWFLPDMCDFLDRDAVVTLHAGELFKIDGSEYWFTPEMVEYVVKY